MDIHDLRFPTKPIKIRRAPSGGGPVKEPVKEFVKETTEAYSPCLENVCPPLTLVLGPAGAGKTEWTLARFVTQVRAGSQALLLVSSPQQAQTRAAQLAARLNCAPADILPCLLTFRQLAAHLTAESDDEDDQLPAVPSIGRAFQRLALSDLFRKTIRPDDFLGRMLRAPGFVPALTERLREWKLACLTPETLRQSGPIVARRLADPTFQQKAEELARLFQAYEEFLTRNRLRDEEDGLRLAVERIKTGAASLPQHAACILVDGFYRFNPMQRHLLAACARYAQTTDGEPVEVAITLPYETRRPLLFAAPGRTLHLLRQEFACHETTLAFASPTRPAALALLSDHLFNHEGVQAFGCSGVQENPLASTPAPERLLDSPEHPTPNTQHPTPNTPVLQLFDAPNPYVEAEMVARAFRRLHDAGGYVWSDFAIILRAMGDYAPILAAVFERHGIPLGVDGPEVLTENPFLKTLLHLLNVARRGWQREDVLAFLKSSYTAPDKLEADTMRRRACQSGVREGRAQWLALAEKMEEGRRKTEDGRWKTEDETFQHPEHPNARTPEHPNTQHPIPNTQHPTPSITATLRDMDYYDTLLTRDRQDPRRFAALIEEIVAFFGLEERIMLGEPNRQERDRAAWVAAKDTLQALAQMAALSGHSLMTFEAFHDELVAAWNTASSIAAPDGDMVRVAEPYDARERALKVAAVMGLTERVFPRRITEDPFLRDEERVALREWANLDLEEQKGRADDERFFFYLAVTAPAERLILSYPRSTDESDTLPSFYLDEVREVFRGWMLGVGCSGIGYSGVQDNALAANLILNTGRPLADKHPTPSPRTPNTQHPTPNTQHLHIVSRTLADVAPRAEEVVTPADRLLAACAGLFDPGGPASDRHSLRHALTLMQACLREEPDRVAAQRVVASRGLPRLPRLDADSLRRAFAASRAVFSVSELESYGRCPFQYFLRHVLRLRPDEDGIPAHAQGALLHAVLRRYFTEEENSRGEETTPEHPTPNTQHPTPNSMREALQRILAEMLAEAKMDASLHQTRMTHRMLADALEGFVTREERFGAQFGMTPAYFELAFGTGCRAEWEEDEEHALDMISELQEAALNHSRYDAASSAEPLLLHVTDGGPPVAVCGTLDRVDLDATGRRALALDYKLGHPPDFAEIQRGNSLQMPLYLLALERVFDKVGAVACYDSARERGRRRFHRSEHVSSRQFAPVTPLEDGATVTPLNRGQYADLLKTTEATAIRLARAIVNGAIEATPGDHCRACSYSDVCRTSALGGHDGETIPIVS